MNHFYTLLTAAIVAASSISAANPYSAQAMAELKKQECITNKLQHVDAVRLPLAPQSKAYRADEAITDPQGEASLYTREAYGYYVMGSSPFMSSTDDFTSRVVVDGNDVYLQCPCYEFTNDFGMSTYIKGALDGDKITFQFPQYIGSVQNVPLYVNRMKLEYTNVEEQLVMYFADTENDKITYTRKADASIVMEESDYFSDEIDMADFILGITDAENNWIGYGEWNSVFSICTEVATMRPAGVEFRDCQMRSSGVAALKPMTGQHVAVGVDGNKIYLSNISADFPDACAVGVLDGDKATFLSHQYLGVNSYWNQKEYFWTFMYEWGYDDYYQYEGWLMKTTDNLVLNYDAANCVLTTQSAYDGFLLNLSNTEMSYDDVFIDLDIKPVATFKTSAPENPVIWSVDEYNPDPYYNFARIAFALSMFNVDDNLMDLNNVYYNIYFGNELFTFTPARFENLTEDITDVPFNFTDTPAYGGYEIKVNGIQHFIYFDNWPDVPINDIGVQSLYKTADGEMYKSDIVYYKWDAGVGSSIADVEVVKVEYFNLAGIAVERPENGVFIKVSTLSDGTRSSQKVMK